MCMQLVLNMSERELWNKKVSMVKFVADTALTNKWRKILHLFLSFCSFLILPLRFLLSVLNLPTSLFVFHFYLVLILFIIVLNQLAVLLIFELTHLKENKTCDIWCVFCDIYNLIFPSRLAMQLSWGQRQSSVLVSLACAVCTKCLLQKFGTKIVFCSSGTSYSW